MGNSHVTQMYSNLAHVDALFFFFLLLQVPPSQVDDDGHGGLGRNDEDVDVNNYGGGKDDVTGNSND